jgi:hypothetical protein
MRKGLSAGIRETFVFQALHENSYEQQIGGDLSLLCFLGAVA